MVWGALLICGDDIQTRQAMPDFHRLTQGCSRRSACSADHPIAG